MFGRKPAPVQCTFLGYPNTTGVAAVDYRLTDAQFAPEGDERYSAEQIVRLARGACCFSPKLGTPDPGPLPALKNGYITFGSLHRLSKINTGVYDLWASVLHRLPTSKLLMYRDTLSGKARDLVQHEFGKRGIPAERLDLRYEAGAVGYLSVFHDIDVSLDTFPYNGGTISCESVWMGVPYVTLRGDRPAARAGASLLSAVGMPELIATSTDEYVELTAKLASDLDHLVALRATLRERMLTTMADCEGYTREFEQVLRELWTRWATGTPGSKS
jgi:predicted O-linked N-acetylglucosamine transferase (SPINDLY family)